MCVRASSSRKHPLRKEFDEGLQILLRQVHTGALSDARDCPQLKVKALFGTYAATVEQQVVARRRRRRNS
jgi:hypothetical protein